MCSYCIAKSHGLLLHSHGCEIKSGWRPGYEVREEWGLEKRLSMLKT